MADKRAFAKFDVGYLSNPKVAAVLDESPTAVILHFASVLYAAQHLTDGVVPIRLLLRITGATPDDVTLLVKHGLWNERDGRDAEVHDFLEHQRSAAEAKAASESGRRAVRARYDRAARGRENDSYTERSTEGNTDRSTDRIPREKREREERTTTSPIADAIPDPQRDDVDRICTHLADRVEANGAKRPTITKTWRDSARLLLDKDGRTEAQIVWLIDWATRDEFWRPNILSMPKFREKYDQLMLKARPGSDGPRRPNLNPWRGQ